MTNYAGSPRRWLDRLWHRLFFSDRGESRRPPPYKLEVPEGGVRIGSPFYIRRKADEEIERQLVGSHTITAISGAHQTGKTSILIRAAKYAFHQDHLVLFIDSSRITNEQSADDLDEFLKAIALDIGSQAEVGREQVRLAWSSPLSSKVKLTEFFEAFILDLAKRPVSLIMDNADVVTKTSFCTEFFSLFRSWHNRSAFDARWTKLNILLAISVHPSFLISFSPQSPFNVGTRIELDDFTETQIRELNELHGNPLRPHEIAAAMSLLGGHPYLIRQALYTLVSQNLTWSELDAVAADRDGPFGAHLDHTLRPLEDPELEEAVRKMLRNRICPRDSLFLRLDSARLVKQQGRRCICKYRLYDRFYTSQLL